MRTDQHIAKHSSEPAPKGRKSREPGHKGRRKGRTLRVLLILIVLLLAAVGGAGYYVYHSAEESLDLAFTEASPAVEFGSECSAMSLVASHEGDVTPAAEMLDTLTIGEGEMAYTVSKPVFGGILTVSKDFTLAYTVTDSVPPVCLRSGDGAVVLRGTEFDIEEIIAYGDNADAHPAVTVEGDIDMNTNGRYPLHVTVTDASGNSEDWDLTVSVADSYPEYVDNTPRTAFGDFTTAHKGDGRKFGIDVSTWQGDIDFNAVMDAGCDFVIIRIGYSVDGEVNIDSKFEQNYERAKAAGIRMGLYLYSYDNTEEKARASAKWIIEKLGGDSLDLPIAFDWEDWGNFQDYEMSFTELNRMYDAFAEELAAAGYDSMLYSSKYYLENVWEGTDTRPVWLAHYTNETNYKGPFIMWQASCWGRINGIDGDVDMDILYE